MGVALHLENAFWEIGSASFFNCFFSTIVHHLEPQDRGTRFPMVEQLYGGSLRPEQAAEARVELQTLRLELRRLSPDQVVWDLEDVAAKPPWGSNISSDVTDLSNYFLTSDGRDLFDVVLEALAGAEDSGQVLRVE